MDLKKKNLNMCEVKLYSNWIGLVIHFDSSENMDMDFFLRGSEGRVGAYNNLDYFISFVKHMKYATWFGQTNVRLIQIIIKSQN